MSQKEFDPRDYVVEERYPKRSRKNKIDDLSLIDEPDSNFVNKAERLSTLPYPIDEIIESPEYKHDDVICRLPIQEFTLEYIKHTGLLRPLFFNVPPEQLGMRMPNHEEFSVSDVLECVGGDRRIEVVEVYEQKGTYMFLKDFIDYYKAQPSKRSKLLNVLSLEFTSTKLAEKVSAPAFVSKIDWIDNIWPKELFKRQENLLQKSAWARSNDFSTYPKVQRYCLMSVAKCFTDFHIDFGGTSVWYHILKGEKIFWLIEPTEENLKLYEEWILGGSENSCFFGRFVNKCARIELRQGNTLIIPSGWIHCVYTPVDSLVFGGNFLHSFSIPMQIRVSKSEDRIKIGSKYRFPHFKQMFWCYIATVVRKATRRIYQKQLPEVAHIPANPSPQKSFLQGSADEEDKNDASITDDTDDLTSSALFEGNFGGEAQSIQTPCFTADGEEICYDEDLGNAQDGSLTYNPIQSIYGIRDKEAFTAAQSYDLAYLHSLSWMEINGLHSLADFSKKLIRSKQPEVIEGITRPHHLVAELQALLNKINELDLLHLQAEFNFLSKSKSHASADVTIPGPKEDPVTLTLREPPKNVKKKLKRQTTIVDAVPKKSLKKKTIVSPSASNGPILVDGLPLPTHLNTSTPVASSFVGDVVKLGQMPMQSAWRKSSKMLKPPPATQIQQLKKQRFEVTSDDRKKAEDSSFESKDQIEEHPATNSASTTQDEKVPFSEPTKERKFSQRVRNAIPKVSANKILEIHDDSPEFIHRSPLQRIKGQEIPNQDTTPTPSFSSSGQNETHKQSIADGFNNSGFRRDDNDDKSSGGNFNKNNRSSFGRGGFNNSNKSGFRQDGFNNNNNNSGFGRGGFDDNNKSGFGRGGFNNNRSGFERDGFKNNNKSNYGRGGFNNNNNRSGGFNSGFRQNSNGSGFNNDNRSSELGRGGGRGGFNSNNSNFGRNRSGGGFNNNNYNNNSGFGGSGFNNNNNSNFDRRKSWGSQERYGGKNQWNSNNQEYRNNHGGFSQQRWNNVDDKNETFTEQEHHEGFMQDSFNNSGPYHSMTNTTTPNSYASANFSQRYESLEAEIDPDKPMTSFGETSYSGIATQMPSISSMPGPVPPLQQPLSTTVNELHLISRRMDAPSGIGFAEIDLDQIPLPSESSPKPPLGSTAAESIRTSGQQRSFANPNSANDPFADVDQLADISRMMVDN